MNDEFTTVSSSTQVEIEKEGEIKVIPFKSGVTSDHIVTVSLESTGLSGVTPQYIKAAYSTPFRPPILLHSGH